jgi:MoaA/NifB/PqqE/SkfB family radical SAM enzyme/tetratricopeptide (TPR) repeat protein
LRKWDLEKIRGRLYGHDLPYCTADVGQILEHLPGGWKPDLFLWVESGVSYPLHGVSSLPCPTACWLIDTHLHLERHLEVAKSFDLVFLAQKKYVPLFREAGIRQVHWLPLACDPEIHRNFGLEPVYDVSFVGSITAAHRRRNVLLQRLSRRFSLHVERCFLEEMALVFSRSRIVFNCSVRDDLNMRVFEALSAGSLLLTDQAAGSGLEELFEDGRHLAIYRSPEELEERAAHYLGREEERASIAREGMQEVRARHTYAHRAAAILERVGLWESGSGSFDPARNGYRLGCGRHDDRIAQAVGEIYAREGRPEVAFRYFSQALSLNPENAQALKGMISTARGGAERAETIKSLEAYLALHPADLELTLSHADLCLQAGLPDESRRSVERILLFDPSHEAARHMLIRLQSVHGASEDRTPQQNPIGRAAFQVEGNGPPLRPPCSRSPRDSSKNLVEENVRLNDLEIAQSAEICTSWPKTLVLNLSAACNLMCRFCAQTWFHNDFARGHRLTHIDAEKLERILSDVEVGYPLHVDLQGDGEPLLQPDFKEIFALCREKFPFSFIRVCSNGVPLTPSMSDFLVEGGLAWLNVSLNAGSPEVHERVCGAKVFHRIVSNLRYLQSRKAAAGTILPQVGMSYVLARYNLDDVENFLRLCAELGVPFATIQYMTVVSEEALSDSVVHEKARTNLILERARALSEDLGLHVNFPPLFRSNGQGATDNPPPLQDFPFAERFRLRARARAAGLSNKRPQKDPPGNPTPRRDLDRRPRLEKPAAFRCGYPWDFISLRGDGSAQLCCGAIGDEDGNALREGFWNVWNGPVRRYLRRTVNSSRVDAVCDRCPLNRVRDVDDADTHRARNLYQ